MAELITLIHDVMVWVAIGSGALLGLRYGSVGAIGMVIMAVLGVVFCSALNTPQMTTWFILCLVGYFGGWLLNQSVKIFAGIITGR